MADVGEMALDAQREAAYQEIKRRMASLDEANERQLRYFFSVTCIHVRQEMPVFAPNENQTLWQRWLSERRQHDPNSQVI